MKLSEALKSLGEEKATERLSALSPAELEWVNSNLDAEVDLPTPGIGSALKDEFAGAGKFYLGNALAQPAEFGMGMSRLTGGVTDEDIRNQLKGYEDVAGGSGPIVPQAEMKQGTDEMYQRAAQLRVEGAKQMGPGFVQDLTRTGLSLASPMSAATMAIGGIPAFAATGYGEALARGKGPVSLKEGTIATLEQIPLLALHGVSKIAAPAGKAIYQQLMQSLGVATGASLMSEPARYATAKLKGEPYSPETVSSIAKLAVIDAFFRLRGETNRLKELNEVNSNFQKGQVAKGEEIVRAIVDNTDSSKQQDLAETLDSINVTQDENGIKVSFKTPNGIATASGKNLDEVVNKIADISKTTPGATIKEKVKVKETGQVVTIERDAKEALKETDEKIKRHENLLDKLEKFKICMGW